MTYQTIGNVRYHIKGNAPRLVIHSGTHGNEQHVIKPLEKVVERMYNELPSFLFVPEVSPSAIAQGTRENNLGHDLNRVFWGANFDPEVVANKQILSYASHAIALTFHEDLEFNQFCIYDSNLLSEEQLASVRARIKQLELPLFSGYDDFEDVNLKYQFVEGYASNASGPRYEGPFVDDWAMYHSHVSRMLTIEMPFGKPHVEEAIEHCLRLGIQLAEESEDQETASVLQYAT